jgi:hypothetical protein
MSSPPVLQPSPESVFTQEYWGEPTALPAYNRNRSFPPIRSGEISELCAAAAVAIFTGQDREKVPGDTALDTAEPNEYTTPGSVLLVDIEALGPSDNKKDLGLEAKKPHYRSLWMDTGDLLVSPERLFRENSCEPKWSISPQILVYPYRKTLRNPELNTDYSRVVGMLIFCAGKNGEPANELMSIYGEAFDPIRGTVGRNMFRLASIYNISPLAVGNTHTLKNWGWTGWPENTFPKEGLVRIRSAELCLQGIMHQAEAKQKGHRLSIVKAPVLAPNPT